MRGRGVRGCVCVRVCPAMRGRRSPGAAGTGSCGGGRPVRRAGALTTLLVKVPPVLFCVLLCFSRQQDYINAYGESSCKITRCRLEITSIQQIVLCMSEKDYTGS